MSRHFAAFEDADDVHIEEFETANGRTVVVDFGPAAAGLTVDVVDDTIIVVDDAESQYEMPLPSEQSRTFIRNGVLTIEVQE